MQNDETDYEVDPDFDGELGTEDLSWLSGGVKDPFGRCIESTSDDFS